MDDNYWLKRVITKLHAKLLSNNLLGNWAPDGEDSNAESRALDTLEIAGIIKSPGGFEGAPPHLQYRVTDLRSGMTRSAPNRRIVDFDYDKFIRFCEANGLNPTANGMSAQLEIIDGVQPIIHIEGDRYPLTSMDASGLPQKIIAFAWNNPDRRISLDELRQNIGMNQIKKDDARLTQILDKKNVFGKNGILRAFAEIEVRSFLLRQTAILTPNEIVAIKTASTNRR